MSHVCMAKTRGAIRRALTTTTLQDGAVLMTLNRMLGERDGLALRGTTRLTGARLGPLTDRADVQARLARITQVLQMIATRSDPHCRMGGWFRIAGTEYPDFGTSHGYYWLRTRSGLLRAVHSSGGVQMSVRGVPGVVDMTVRGAAHRLLEGGVRFFMTSGPVNFYLDRRILDLQTGAWRPYGEQSDGSSPGWD